MSALAAPPRQRRKEARPDELLDAALELFVEKGYAATRADEVAQRAGVSKGTLYLYFPSKKELFKALIRQRLSNLIAEGFDAAAVHEGSSAELLARLAGIWWQRVGQTPAGGLHKVIVAEVRNFPELAQFWADEVIEPARRLVSLAIERGIERGELRDDLPAREVALALIAPLIFVALHRHSLGCCPTVGAEVDPEALLRTHLELMLHGLTRQGAAAAPASGTRQPQHLESSGPHRTRQP